MTDNQRVITVWSTALNYSSCMRKYDYTVNQLRVPMTSAPALDKGTIVHAAMETYYKGIMQGLDFDTRVQAALNALQAKAMESGLNSEDIIMCDKTCREYFSYYKGDPLVPIAVEAPFSYVLHEDGERKVIFEGKFDVVFQNPLQDNLILVTDHKTGSRNSEPSGLSNQFMGYTVVGQSFGAKRMAMVNKIGFQKTLPPDKKFVRHHLPYSKEVLDDWVEWTVARAIYIDNCNQLGQYPPDFTKCDEYSGCFFKDVCLAPPKLRPEYLARFFKIGEPHDVFGGEE